MVVVVQNMCDDLRPDARFSQLLRSSRSPALKPLGCQFEVALDLFGLGVRTEDHECAHALVDAHLGCVYQIHWSGGDRFACHKRVDQFDVNAPAVVEVRVRKPEKGIYFIIGYSALRCRSG